MAKVVQAITARVEVIGKLKTGNYGKYRSVLFLDQAQPLGSESAKIWKSLSEEEAEGLTQGAFSAKRNCEAPVHLVPAGKDRNGKEKQNILQIEADSPPIRRTIDRPDSIPATWNDEQKIALSAQICDHADLLRFCLEVAHEKFAGLADQRDFRALATTLYLQVLRQQTDSELNP